MSLVVLGMQLGYKKNIVLNKIINGHNENEDPISS